MRPMTYEQGLLCIGRRVRVFRSDKCHANPATLKEAHKKWAVVRIDGHGKDENLPWSQVADWVSANGGPAPVLVEIKPTVTGVAMPELTAMENRSMKAESTATDHRQQAENLRKIAGEADLVSLGDVGARLKRAVDEAKRSEKDLAEARAMVLDAEAAHAKKIADLREIRRQVADVLSSIDSMIPSI